MFVIFSDHYSVFHVIKTGIENCDINIIKKRQFNDINISQFRTKLSTCDWSNLYLTSDPQIAFTQFYNIFKDNFDKCFPLKTYNSTYFNKNNFQFFKTF